VMSAHPAALQLRLLETVVEVAAEKNSTLVLPFPVELLRFLERVTPGETGAIASQAPSAGRAASDSAASDSGASDPLTAADRSGSNGVAPAGRGHVTDSTRAVASSALAGR
jgi:hypothetical protein